MTKYLIGSIFIIIGAVIYKPQILTADEKATEQQLGRLINTAEKFARRGRWNDAIESGERMVRATFILDGENSERYVNLLTMLMSYYDDAGKIGIVADRTAKVYELSKLIKGNAHYTTGRARTLYYKALVVNKSYKTAIPLVEENISLYNNSGDDYRLYKYNQQLFALYGLTSDYKNEERAILKAIAHYKTITGHVNKELAYSLAQSYCRQKMYNAFNTHIAKYNLEYTCK